MSDYDDEETKDLTDREVYLMIWQAVWDNTHNNADAIGTAGVVLHALRRIEKEPPSE